MQCGSQARLTPQQQPLVPSTLPLIARISPVGFHRTKESCQRSLQRVTSPSATAVMFPLLLTSTPTPTTHQFFFLFKLLLTLVWAGHFLPERFKLSVFKTHISKLGVKGEKKTDVSLMPFYLSTMKLWKDTRERERSEKTFAEIFLQSTSFLSMTGNTSFVLMQY